MQSMALLRSCASHGSIPDVGAAQTLARGPIVPPIVSAEGGIDREPRFGTRDAATMLLGLLVAAVGAFAWLGPARVTVGHRLELDDPRLGAEPFELTIALDPRSGEATLTDLPMSRPREGETFPVPYGPDAGRKVHVVGVERSGGVVRIRTRCPTCRTVEWGRRDGVLEISSVGGTVAPGMGYQLHVRAGAGPLEVQVRSGEVAPWRHGLDPLDAVALQAADCPSEGGPCSLGPGFALEDDQPALVRLRADQGSPGFEVRLSGSAQRDVAMRDRRSGLANGAFAAWLVLGLLVAGASLVGMPSARVRAAVLLGVGLSVPVALWVPGFSRWYWWPPRPVPMGPLLAASSLIVSAGAAWVLSRSLGLPWAGPRRLVVVGTVATVAALVLLAPALLMDDAVDVLVDIPLVDGAQLAYLSLSASTALGVVGGWLLGAAGRDRATMAEDGRRAMP